MPHLVTIEPCTGYSAKGPIWGEPGEPVRANLNGGRGQGRSIDTGVGSFTITKTAEITLDATLPLLSRVTNTATGNDYVVGAVVDWDQPPVQPFTVAALGLLVV
jgi:hypothetical protein